jgi:hypothetical protein
VIHSALVRFITVSLVDRDSYPGSVDNRDSFLLSSGPWLPPRTCDGTTGPIHGLAVATGSLKLNLIAVPWHFSQLGANVVLASDKCQISGAKGLSS